MKKFTVKISNQEFIIWAKDHNSAVKQALSKETEKPKIISVLTTCLKEGDEEEDEMLYHYQWLINNGYINTKDFQYYD